jgi:hypothetical protein
MFALVMANKAESRLAEPGAIGHTLARVSTHERSPHSPKGNVLTRNPLIVSELSASQHEQHSQHAFSAVGEA